jgi:hypothetical protein
MHSKLYIHLQKGKKFHFSFLGLTFGTLIQQMHLKLYISPLLDLKVVGLDDVVPTIIDIESFMRSWYIN